MLNNSDFDAKKFLEMEFLTLRKEIEDSKDRQFKLIVGGAGAIPAAQGIADNYSIAEITIALPLIVAVLVLLFLSENHSMMRAGTYILEKIEPSVEGHIGWETWLNESHVPTGTRSVDKLSMLAFSVLASCYFLAACYFAVRHLINTYGENPWSLSAIAIYSLLGIVLGWVVYSQSRTDTILNK